MGNDRKFKVGELVQLMSGGPVMTVDKTENTGYAVCLWFVGTELKSGHFAYDSIKGVKPEDINRGPVTGDGPSVSIPPDTFR